MILKMSIVNSGEFHQIFNSLTSSICAHTPHTILEEMVSIHYDLGLCFSCKYTLNYWAEYIQKVI